MNSEELRPATPEELELARAWYDDDGLEIDDDALVAEGEDGEVWVQAWVRVSRPIEGGDDDES